MKKNRRKKYILDRKFQYQFIAFCLVSSMIVLAVLYFGNLYHINKFYDLAKQMGLEPGHMFYQFLDLQNITMNMIFLGASLICISIGFFFGIVYSHKIIGPIQKIHRALQRIEQGKEIQPIQLRENDYFQYIADDINRIVTKMHSTTEAQKSQDS